MTCYRRARGRDATSFRQAIRVALPAILFVPLPVVHAATETFQFLNSQNGSDLWSDAASWSPDHRLPEAGDNAYLVIQSGQTVATRTVLYDQPASPVVALNELRLDSTSPDGPVVLNQPSGGLQAVNQNVGYDGAAIFNQSGGTNQATTQLYLGRNAGSSGTYTLSNGNLSAGMISVGYNGSGAFTQSGGTVSVSQFVNVGDQTAGTGEYDMTGGTLNTAGLTIGFMGAGTFRQSGNSAVNVGSMMYISATPAAPGAARSYLIQGGTLTAPNLDLNGATFTQTGGSVAIRQFSADLSITTNSSTINHAAIELDGGTFTGGLELFGGTTLHQAAANSLHATQMFVTGGSTADLQGAVTLTAGFHADGQGTQLTIAQPISWAVGGPAQLNMLVENGASANLPAGWTIGGAGQLADAAATVSGGGKVAAGNIVISATGPGVPPNLPVLYVSDPDTAVTQNGAAKLDIASQPGSTGWLRLLNHATFATGTGTITVGAGGTIQIGSGTFTANGPMINNGTFSFIDGGTATLRNVAGAGTLSIGDGPAAVSVTSLSQGTLGVGGYGVLKVLHSASPVLNTVNSLRITDDLSGGYPRGIVDLTNNSLDVHYGGGPSPDATIRDYLTTGYDAGKWDGRGILSSTAMSEGRTLGYADGADAVVHGLAAGDELVKYTLPGDVNLDGRVDFSDLLILGQHYGSTTAKWDQGDFNYDGKADFTDLLTLAQHYGGSLTSAQLADFTPSFQADVERAFAAVPEPSAVALFGLAACTLMRRRRW